jgi:itaconate CoA-transferase
LGDVRLSHDPRFASNVNRVDHRDLTDKVVAEAFLRRSSDQALADLTKADVAFALLNDMAGLSVHPELRRITVETPNGPVTYPAPASRFDGVTRPFGPVPELDEGC